jgi:hypothetical protein
MEGCGRRAAEIATKHHANVPVIHPRIVCSFLVCMLWRKVCHGGKPQQEGDDPLSGKHFARCAGTTLVFSGRQPSLAPHLQSLAGALSERKGKVVR